MEIKSFSVYEELYNRVELQKEALAEVISSNDTKLIELMMEYNQKLINGQKLDATSKAIKLIKQDTAAAKDELAIIENSASLLGPYAAEVKAEHDSLRVEVLEKVNSLHEASEAVLEEAKQKCEANKAEAKSLLDQFYMVRENQFIPVIDHLEASENTKDGLRFNARQEIAQVEVFPTIKR